MNLPRKDKDNISYLSYSQMSLFKRDKHEYYEQYILGKPFKPNPWVDFGSKVGEALEVNDFSKFTPSEQEILRQAPRYDLFEHEIKLWYPEHGFFIKGFIDTCPSSFEVLQDYKTGGKDKEHQYKKEDYTQLCLYALGIKQQHKVLPSKAHVCFIRREGNPYRGEELMIANEKPLLIEVDISLPRLKRVYWESLKIAQEIEQFYLTFKPK